MKLPLFPPSQTQAGPSRTLGPDPDCHVFVKSHPNENTLPGAAEYSTLNGRALIIVPFVPTIRIHRVAMNMYMLNCTLKFQSFACMRLLLGAKSMPFVCMSMDRLGACMRMLGASLRRRLGACMRLLGASFITAESLPDCR